MARRLTYRQWTFAERQYLRSIIDRYNGLLTLSFWKHVARCMGRTVKSVRQQAQRRHMYRVSGRTSFTPGVSWHCVR